MATRQNHLFELIIELRTSVRFVLCIENLSRTCDGEVRNFYRGKATYIIRTLTLEKFSAQSLMPDGLGV